MPRLNFFFCLHQVCVIFCHVVYTFLYRVCAGTDAPFLSRFFNFYGPFLKTAASSHHYFIRSMILGNVLKTNQSGLHVLLYLFFFF